MNDHRPSVRTEKPWPVVWSLAIALLGCAMPAWALGPNLLGNGGLLSKGLDHPALPGPKLEVLRHMARFLMRYVRAEEAVVRIGGDEFVVLLRGANAQETKIVLDINPVRAGYRSFEFDCPAHGQRRKT